MSTLQKKYRSLFLLFCCIGLILLFVISWVIDFGVKHSDKDQTGKVNGIINHTIDPQLIVFGSSVGEVGVNSSIIQKQTGLPAFNCSIDGTRFMQYKGLINEFNSYSRNDKYIVLIETYFSFTDIHALTSLERYVAQIDNDNLYHSLYDMQPDLVWKCRNIPFYKYVAVTSVYYKNAMTGWRNIVKKPSVDSLLGYTPVDRKWEADADALFKNVKPFRVGLDSTIIATYIQTIKKLEESGRKVIIVLTPVYSEELNKITDITPLRYKLNQISSVTGATFFDFSDSWLCRKKDFFYNSNHLNRTGSTLFSTMLADSIASIVHTAKNN